MTVGRSAFRPRCQTETSSARWARAVLSLACALVLVLCLASGATAEGNPPEDDSFRRLEQQASELRAVLTQAREMRALLTGDKHAVEHWDMRTPSARDNFTVLAAPLAHMYAASLVAGDRARGAAGTNYSLSDFSPYARTTLPIVPDLMLNLSLSNPNASPVAAPSTAPGAAAAARAWPLPPRTYLDSLRGVWHAASWSLDADSAIQQPKPMPSKTPKPYRPAAPEVPVHPVFPPPRPASPVDNLDASTKERVAKQQNDLLTLLFGSARNFPGAHGGHDLAGFRHILGGEAEMDLLETSVSGTAAGVVPIMGTLTLGRASSDWDQSSVPACGRRLPSAGRKDAHPPDGDGPLHPMPNALQFDVTGVHIRPHGLFYAQVLSETDPHWVDSREALKMVPLPSVRWDEVRELLVNHTYAPDDPLAQARLAEVARESSAWGLWSRVLQTLHAVLSTRVEQVTRRLRDNDRPPSGPVEPTDPDSRNGNDAPGSQNGSNETAPDRSSPASPHRLDSLWSHNCTFHLYGHMQPVGAPQGERAVRSAEWAMRNPRGRAHVHLPESPQMRGILWSPECHLLMRLGEIDTDLSPVRDTASACPAPESRSTEQLDLPSEWQARTRMTGKLDLLRPARALRYTSGVVLLLLFLCHLVTRNMDRSTSPAALARLAWPTWALFCIADVSFFATHLVVAIFFQGQRDTPAWYATAFGFAMLFIALEYQHTLNIWHLHHITNREQAARERMETEHAAAVAAASSPPPSDPSAALGESGSGDTAEGENEGSTTPIPAAPSRPSRRCGWVFVRMAQIAAKVIRQHPVTMTLVIVLPLLSFALSGTALLAGVLVLVHSFWVPQICRNVRRHQRGALERRFIILVSLARMALPTYFLACPDNYAGFSPQPWLAALVDGYVVVQALILLGQGVFGPTFLLSDTLLVRLGMAPQQRWNFFVSPSDAVALLRSRGEVPTSKDGKVELGDCPICFEPIAIPLSASADAQERNEDPEAEAEAAASEHDDNMEAEGLLSNDDTQASPSSRSRFAGAYSTKLSFPIRLVSWAYNWGRRTIDAGAAWRSALARNRRSELMVTPVRFLSCLAYLVPPCRLPVETTADPLPRRSATTYSTHPASSSGYRSRLSARSAVEGWSCDFISRERRVSRLR